jgi:hypothetical protein
MGFVMAPPVQPLFWITEQLVMNLLIARTDGPVSCEVRSRWTGITAISTSGAELHKGFSL